MTLIFCAPTAVRITSNSVCSSTSLGRGSTTADSGRGRRCRRRNAPLLLEHLRELRRLEDGQAREVVDQLIQIRHFYHSRIELMP